MHCRLRLLQMLVPSVSSGLLPCTVRCCTEQEFPYEGRNESQAFVPQSNRFQHYYYAGEKPHASANAALLGQLDARSVGAAANVVT